MKLHCSHTIDTPCDNNSPSLQTEGGKIKAISLLVWVLLSLIIAFVVTRDLPCRPLYEVRYELRVRDYIRNVEGADLALAGISMRDGEWLRGYLEELPVAEGLSRELKVDKTESVSMTVRGMDSTAVANYGNAIYENVRDTIGRYGIEMCNQILSLFEGYGSDTGDVLSEMMVLLETGRVGSLKYIDLLNCDELPQAHKTPLRWVVILLSATSSLLLGIVVLLLKDFSWILRKERNDNEGNR